MSKLIDIKVPDIGDYKDVPVIEVLVKAGDKVQSGKGLLVMSSMKMETTIEGHSDGEVEEIFVGEKSFVEAGTVLVKMKAE